MTPYRMVAGLILLLVGALLYTLNHDYSFIVLVAGIAIVASSFAGSQSRIRRRVNRITSSGIIEAGIQRIKSGKMRIGEAEFSGVMQKLEDILANQSVMPEFGLDSVYLSFAKYSDAENASAEITSRGIRNDVMQEKGSWKVRILF
jgi:hypothetical protein